jgi:hypothetical protein
MEAPEAECRSQELAKDFRKAWEKACIAAGLDGCSWPGHCYA